MTSFALDLALSRRIELAEAHAAVCAAEALAQFRCDSSVAVEKIAGGFAVYCGAKSPVTQAVGLGLSGVVSAEQFDELEAFYARRNEPVRVETSPLVHPSLMELFGKRRYRVTEFTNVMVRRVSSTGSKSILETAPESEKGKSEVTVELVPRERIGFWSQTVARGFSEHAPMMPEILDVMRAFASAPGVECYLARVNGAVAGGGTLILRDGIGGLFGASTLPAFRRRGVQAALLQRRIARAAEADCDLAACLAQPGSSSQRNVARHGFETLYTRVKFERDLSAG